MTKKAAPTIGKIQTSAKPTAKPDSAEAKSKKRQPHPALFNKAGERVKLAEVPENFDAKIHSPLKARDFEHDYVYMRWQADQLEDKAKRLRSQAEQSEKLGDSKDRAKAKKLIAMTKRIEELKSQLADDGVDIDAILGALSGYKE